MQEAEERRKRLKAIRDTASGPECYASGREKMNNPLLDGPAAQSSAPSFSFYSDPLAALKSARPQPPKGRQDAHAHGQNGAASLGHIRAAPALHLPLPSGARPLTPFPQPEAAWPRPRPGPPSQYTPPGGHGQQWGRPPPPFGPPSSQGAQWNARPAGHPPYNRGGPPRPPPGPPPPGLPHQSHLTQQGRGYTGGGRRGGAQDRGSGTQGRGRGGGRGGQPGRGRGGGGRGQGRGEADIEAYYSPSMVEDPWRSLRQPQTRQQGAAAGQSPPQLGGNQAAPATGLSTSAHVAAEEEPLVVPAEEVGHGKLSEEGAQDRPWH